MSEKTTIVDGPVETKPDNSSGSYLHHLWASIAFTITLGIICCGVYPLIVWGIAQPFSRPGEWLVAEEGWFVHNE